MKVDALIIIKNEQGTATHHVVADFFEHQDPGSRFKSMNGRFKIEPSTDFAGLLNASFATGKYIILQFFFEDGEKCAQALIKRIQPMSGEVGYLISGPLAPCATFL